MVTPIKETDILSAVIDAGKGEGEKDWIAYTKDIVLLMGERFPDVHMMTVLAIMGRLKRDGLLGYDPAHMMWWITKEGKAVLKDEASEIGKH